MDKIRKTGKVPEKMKRNWDFQVAEEISRKLAKCMAILENSLAVSYELKSTLTI